MLKIRKASDMTHKPTLNFLVYGDPKIGKSTFAIKSKKVLIADCESGYRFMGMNGLDGDIAEIETWEDMADLYKVAVSGKYDLVVIDPINELLEKLMAKMKKQDKNGNVNKRYALISGYDEYKSNGILIRKPLIELTMSGWGMIKSRFKEMLKVFRDVNMNVLIIAHTKEDDYEGITKKSPKLDANLAKDLMGMMDVIGYMKIASVNGEKKRIVQFESSETYDAGDRTNVLPKTVEADNGFQGVYDLIINNKNYTKTIEMEQISKPEEDNTSEEIVDSTKDTSKEEEEKPDTTQEENQTKVESKVDYLNLMNKIIRLMKTYYSAADKKEAYAKAAEISGLEWNHINLEKILEIINQKIKNGINK